MPFEADETVNVAWKANFDLLFHTSWLESHDERMAYRSDGRWEVDSKLSVNTNRLLDLARAAMTPEGEIPIPLPDLLKSDYDANLRVVSSEGVELKVLPEELSFTFEWLAILGCIEHSLCQNESPVDELSRLRASGLIKGNAYSRIPSAELGRLMWEEIRNPLPPTLSDLGSLSFFERFEERICHDKSLSADDGGRFAVLREWRWYVRSVPGFAQLFKMYCFSWSPLVNLPVVEDRELSGGMTPEILRVSFSDYVSTIFSDRAGDWRVGLTMRYPLRRVGFAESESFYVEAPKMTLFLPVGSANANAAWGDIVFQDECLAYAEEDAPSAIQVMGRLSDSGVFVRVNSAWNDDTDSVYHRLVVPEMLSPSSGTDWKRQAEIGSHSYSLITGWRAQPGRRGRAYLTFMFISAVAMLYLICGIANGQSLELGKGDVFLTVLCIVVPLSALLFSNLQEKTTYFRSKLSEAPKRWLGWAIAVTVAVFLVFLFGKTLGLPLVIGFVAAGAGLTILSVLLYRMLVWCDYNDGPDCKNKEWSKRRGVLALNEIAVSQVSPTQRR